MHCLMNEFYVQPGTEGILKGLGSALEGMATRDRMQDQQARLQQGAELLQSNDPNAVAQWAMTNPDLADVFWGSLEAQDKLTKEDRLSFDKRVLTGVVDPRAAYEERINEIKARGGNAAHMEAFLAENPTPEEIREASMKSIALRDPRGYQSFASATGVGGGGSAKMREREDLVNSLIGANNPKTNKPYTREEAMQEVALREAGIVARAVGSAGITTATTPGLTEKVAQSEEEIKERTKFAEMTGASRAKAIDDGFDRISKIDQNIGNYNEALKALDEGANTGVIESKFFPTIKAASVALDQIQNELTLDVLNAATFGALSESELQLAKQTALPTGLPESELRAWIERKKAAQEKLRAYFQEQVDFWDQGGTIAGFLRMKERGLRSGSVRPQDAQQGQIKFLGFE